MGETFNLRNPVHQQGAVSRGPLFEKEFGREMLDIQLKCLG